MTGNEYQELAMRTNDNKATFRASKKLTENFFADQKPDIGEILNASLGLSGEVGELNDMIKKWIFHEKELDVEHVEKEIGDICWYIAMICESFGFAMDEVLQMNIEKLKARYPDGFDTVRANNRSEGDL
jgi:NTP pyrophosphatase (non-canonical NTP hydrolase)